MNRKHFLLLLIFCGSIELSTAQLDNKLFQPVNAPKSEHKLTGEFDFTGFFKNNEYFTNINPGQTYLGWQVFPKLKFSPNQTTSISGGVLFQRNFGIDSTYRKIYFSFNKKVGHWNFTFGSIDNTLKHQLIEPLMDYESFYNERLEEGFEIEYKDSTKSMDLWMDWEEAITRNSANQERFFVGLNLEKKITPKNKINLALPFSTTFYHRGGSINNTESKVSTRIGSSLGLKLQKKGVKNTWFFDNYGLFSYDFSPSLSHTFQDGYGIYSNLGVKRKHMTYLLSYWYGEEFYTPKSGPLFNSTSIEGQQITERIRELIFLRMVYSKQIQDGLQVDIRLEPYFDLQNQDFEYAFGVALKYNLFLNKSDFTN